MHHVWISELLVTRWMMVPLVLVAFAPPSHAGWISIRNETTHVIIVQEVIQVNGQQRRCRPIKLAPGEVLREHQPLGGQKRIIVSEAGLFGKQLYSGQLSWTQDTVFAFQRDMDKFTMNDVSNRSEPLAPVRP